MFDNIKYKGRSINLSRKGYAPQPTKVWLDGWKHRFNPYAHTLLYFLIDITPYKDGKDWTKGVLEVSMADITKELGWSHNTVDKTMQVLYDDGIIDFVTNRGRANNTTITFCDWDGMFESTSEQVEEEPQELEEEPQEQKPVEKPKYNTKDKKAKAMEKPQEFTYAPLKETMLEFDDIDTFVPKEETMLEFDDIDTFVPKEKKVSDIREHMGSLLDSDGYLLSDSVLDRFDFRGMTN